MSNAGFFECAFGEINDADAPFLIAPDGRAVSFGAFQGTATRFAETLLDVASPGDRILTQVEKSEAAAAAYFAALRAGLIYMPVNTAYTDAEVAYFVNDAEPRVILCGPEREAQYRRLAPEARIFTMNARGETALGESVASGHCDFPSVASDDLAAILYTSGTTGRPKGAMLTHGNLTSNAQALAALWKMGPSDALIHALPLFHIHGLFVALNTAALAQTPVVFLPRFDAGEILRVMPRATVIMGVPTFYSRLMAEPEFTQDSAAHMRLFISGSAPLSKDLFERFEQRTGHRILERYGMSETGIIASNPVDGPRVAGSVGYAAPGVEIRIVCKDGEKEIGEVEARGASVFRGYWRRDEETTAAFSEDGWFKTGDLGRIGADGRLFLSGRSKDLIISGGYNIYPKEVENALTAVEGVLEAAVIGAPHADMGEGVVAVLEGDPARADNEALTGALARLAKFKRPRKIYWMDALPRNAMAKVQKRALRERFRDAFSD